MSDTPTLPAEVAYALVLGPPAAMGFGWISTEALAIFAWVWAVMTWDDMP